MVFFEAPRATIDPSTRVMSEETSSIYPDESPVKKTNSLALRLFPEGGSAVDEGSVIQCGSPHLRDLEGFLTMSKKAIKQNKTDIIAYISQLDTKDFIKADKKNYIRLLSLLLSCYNLTIFSSLPEDLAQLQFDRELVLKACIKGNSIYDQSHDLSSAKKEPRTKPMDDLRDNPYSRLLLVVKCSCETEIRHMIDNPEGLSKLNEQTAILYLRCSRTSLVHIEWNLLVFCVKAILDNQRLCQTTDFLSGLCNANLDLPVPAGVLRIIIQHARSHISLLNHVLVQWAHRNSYGYEQESNSPIDTFIRPLLFVVGSIPNEFKTEAEVPSFTMKGWVAMSLLCDYYLAQENEDKEIDPITRQLIQLECNPELAQHPKVIEALPLLERMKARCGE